MKRREFLALPVLLANRASAQSAPTASTAAGPRQGPDVRDISKYLKIPAGTLAHAFRKLKTAPAGAVTLNGSDLPAGFVQDERAFYDQASGPLICSASSPWLQPLYRHAGEAVQRMAVQSLSYAIFCPWVFKPYPEGDVLIRGLSVGRGVVLLSTYDAQRARYPFVHFPPILGHEVRHEHNRRHTPDMSSLKDETEAYETLKEVLERQLSLPLSPEDRTRTERKMAYTNERLRTAAYLKQDRSDGAFEDVYPQIMIRSRELLQAEVDGEALEKVLREAPENTLDVELRAAAQAAITACGQKKRAVKSLYMQAHSQDPLIVLNALYALAYLTPKRIRVDDAYELAPARGDWVTVRAPGEKLIPPLDELIPASASRGLYRAGGRLPPLKALL